MHYSALEQFQKENSLLRQKYQLKNKQYPHHTPQKESYQYNHHKMEKSYHHDLGQTANHSPYQKRFQPNQNAHLEKSNTNYARNSPLTYANSKSFQKDTKDAHSYTPKYGKNASTQKSPQASKYHPLNENIEIPKDYPAEDPSFQNVRPQNGRSKGFQMKMNNIEVMNDKICSLLNIVKHDRTTMFSQMKKNSNILSPNKHGEYSPKRQEIQQAKPKNYRFEDDLKPKAHDKNQRMRTYTGYQKSEHEDSLDARHSKSKKQPKYNEEDTILKYNITRYQNSDLFDKSQARRNQALTPNRSKNYNIGNNDSPKVLNTKKYPLYEQKQQVKKDRHYFANELSPKAPNEEHISQINSINGYSLTKDEYDQIRQYEYVPKFKGTLKRQETGLQSLLPVSIRNTKSRSQHVPHDTGLIDERLKKIKERILESQNGQKTLQRKLDHNTNDSSDKLFSAGRLYRKSEASKEKQFRLKLYPVTVDRQNVVRIAILLNHQAHLDQKVQEHLSSLKNSEVDWNELDQEINVQGINISTEDLQQFAEESHFFEGRKMDSSEIMKYLIEAQKHWQKEVLHCVSAQDLKKDDFDPRQIDTSHRGQICQQDLTNFINSFTGKSIRSASCLLIFKRLKQLQTHERKGLDYSTFMKAMTN